MLSWYFRNRLISGWIFEPSQNKSTFILSAIYGKVKPLCRKKAMKKLNFKIFLPFG